VAAKAGKSTENAHVRCPDQITAQQEDSIELLHDISIASCARVPITGAPVIAATRVRNEPGAAAGPRSSSLSCYD